MSTSDVTAASPWPHRWAAVLACATFPLLWVGGLVTTTDAGMAVPDWPSTYGYNLFLYPWSTWIAGPWDIFVEHGHRLLGALVGMITIVLAIVLWRRDDRRWVQGVGVIALALVILQGVMGGMRVRFDERALAMFHGMTGPLFFALTVALVVLTSRTWRKGDAPRASSIPIRVLTIVTCVLVYLQIVFGAVLRHIPVFAESTAFTHAVRSHLTLAAVLALAISVLVYLVLTRARGVRPLAGLAITLAGLLIAQLALGAGTWIVKFAMPTWAAGWLPPMTLAIQDGGALQTHVITAHMAVGSLLLATAVALALYAHRLLSMSVSRRKARPGSPTPATVNVARALEAAP